MYLVINESGEINKCARVPDVAFMAHAAGILGIIDISNPECPKQYDGDGKWSDIEGIDQ